MTWDRVSSKTVWDDLKPTVLTLAMLLPVTSILVWWARRPEMAENMERSTGRFSSGVGGPGSGAGVGVQAGRLRGCGDLGEPAHLDLDAVDDGDGLALLAGELHSGDDPGLGGAGRVGVGRRPADQGPGGGRLLQDEHRGVLVDQLLELLDLAEGRRLRHHLRGVDRVARVL